MRGYLDFRSATLPSFECVIRADTYDYFDPSHQVDICPNRDLSIFTVPIDVLAASKNKGTFLLTHSLFCLFSSQLTRKC